MLRSLSLNQLPTGKSTCTSDSRLFDLVVVVVGFGVVGFGVVGFGVVGFNVVGSGGFVV